MKIQKTISLDIELVTEAKKQRLMISPIINDFLREYLKLPEDKTSKRASEVKEDVNKLRAELLKKEAELKKTEKKEQENKTIWIE